MYYTASDEWLLENIFMLGAIIAVLVECVYFERVNFKSFRVDDLSFQM